jgi:hypothetical protein
MNSRRRRHTSGLHTTSYVLVETMALLQRRIGLEGLRTFVADILPVVQVAYVDEGIHRSAQHALRVASRSGAKRDRHPSFTACRGSSAEPDHRRGAAGEGGSPSRLV